MFVQARVAAQSLIASGTADRWWSTTSAESVACEHDFDASLRVMVHTSQVTQVAQDLPSPPSITPPSPSQVGLHAADGQGCRQLTALTVYHFQAFDYPSDVARLFLIGRGVLLDYWPAEELIVKDGEPSTSLCTSHLPQYSALAEVHVVELEAVAASGRASTKSFKSVLNGSLVRLASTKQLAQISNGAWDPRGHRVLKLQVGICYLLNCKVSLLLLCSWLHSLA